jgi:hypothetical protein
MQPRSCLPASSLGLRRPEERSGRTAHVQWWAAILATIKGVGNRCLVDGWKFPTR